MRYIGSLIDDKANTKSSNYLEDAATEIQVQGLELDYTCLLWDADMRYDGEWRFYKFNGTTKWNEQLPTTENKQELRKYMLNAYRVLLTRARSGMVIAMYPRIMISPKLLKVFNDFRYNEYEFDKNLVV